MKQTTIALMCMLAIGIVCGDSGCGNKPADVLFVLDESNSIHPPDFKQQLVFLQDTIDTFDVGFDQTRVGVMTFGSKTRIISHLTKYREKEGLKREVAGIEQRGGLETNTHLALKALREKMFSERDARSSVRHLAIVITDGESSYPKETEKEARLCHEANIDVIAIGVGNKTKRTELEVIASSPKLVFTVDSYAALEILKSMLGRETCQTPNPPAPLIIATEPPPIMIEGCSGHKKMDHIWSMSDQADEVETNLAIQFINSVILDMTIDPDHVQVGLTLRFCEEGSGIRLKDHDTGKGFRDALDKRRLVGLRTERTIEYIRTEGHTISNGGRTDAVKYAILIIDNRLYNWEQTLAEAQRAKGDYIRLIVIGVGQGVQQDKLRQLSSSDYNYFYVENYSRLLDLKSRLIKTFCTGITETKKKRRNYFERFLY